MIPSFITMDQARKVLTHTHKLYWYNDNISVKYYLLTLESLSSRFCWSVNPLTSCIRFVTTERHRAKSRRRPSLQTRLKMVRVSAILVYNPDWKSFWQDVTSAELQTTSRRSNNTQSAHVAVGMASPALLPLFIFFPRVIIESSGITVLTNERPLFFFIVSSWYWCCYIDVG